MYVIGALTGAIPGTLMPYFVTYVLRPEGEPLRWISLYLFLYFGTGLLCLPLWVWLANRIGKKATWLFSFVSGGTGSLALFFVPEGDARALRRDPRLGGLVVRRRARSWRRRSRPT